jgi:putative peptide zinc metalloprotease protein
VQQVYRAEPYWLIKDPLEMEFYRLNEEEYTILTMVDGKQSLEEIKEKFEHRFPSQRITHRELQSFISDLHSKSLLAYTDPDVGMRLVDRAKEKRWKKVKENLSGILTIKWRGVDPDRFLDWLTPRIGWIFSLPAVLASLFFMGAAVLWLLAHLDTFLTRLPGLDAFLQQRNWLLLGIVIITLKIVHELGHGVSFKRFGGECHEIGVMWMLFIPTLYCSTTDSWLLRNKWQRAAIGAAGMYVELLVAACATFAWWFSQPGTFNMLCLNIMATGSVSVLLFNANPFLKYDGYYILSDILELPNLRERAGKMTQGWFLKYCLGIEEQTEPNSRFDTKVTLVTYKVAAFSFRILIVSMVLFLLIGRLNPFGLGYFGLALGCFAFSSLFAPPLWSLFQFFKVPGRLQRMQMKRSLPTLFIAIALVAFVCGVPLPHYVTCPFTVQPRGGQALYVRHDAILKSVHVTPGQEVTKGTVIAVLENVEVLLKLSHLQAEGTEIEAELQLLERARNSTPATVTKLKELQESLATNSSSRRKYEEIVSSFRIEAPRSGEVIPEWINHRREVSGQLNSWDGSPLADENLGASLASGDKLCTIGNLKMMEAVLIVKEQDIRWVKDGQHATLLLDSTAQRRIAGRIDSVARKESEQLPESLSAQNGGSIQQRTTADAVTSQPADEHFEARVLLDTSSRNLTNGLRGQARIYVGSRTLYQRAKQTFFRVFHKAL